MNRIVFQAGKRKKWKTLLKNNGTLAIIIGIFKHSFHVLQGSVPDHYVVNTCGMSPNKVVVLGGVVWGALFWDFF